jgi:hypothetical protein
MAPLRRFLEGAFQEGLDLPAGSICIVQDTSAMGPVRGRWARPDYILVSAMRFKLMPGSQIDVHSFELKTESGATDLAVYEALAQTRFTHFGHLVWHLPTNSKAEARLAEIEKQCEEHGIGLIRMTGTQSFRKLRDFARSCSKTDSTPDCRWFSRIAALKGAVRRAHAAQRRRPNMRGKVIAVANMKGGVGKTATIVGLAETLAAGGDEVLVIDLDPQASASMCFAGDALLAKLIEEARTIDAFVEDFILKSRQIRFDDCIRANVSEVSHLSNQLPISLLASSPALRVLERELIYKLTKEKFDLNAIVERLFENDEKRTQENKEII